VGRWYIRKSSSAPKIIGNLLNFLTFDRREGMEAVSQQPWSSRLQKLKGQRSLSMYLVLDVS